jgi:hypothetical protein
LKKQDDKEHDIDQKQSDVYEKLSQFGKNFKQTAKVNTKAIEQQRLHAARTNTVTSKTVKTGNNGTRDSRKSITSSANNIYEDY